MSEEFTYQLYKVANEKYGCRFTELEGEEHDDAVRIAKRKVRIEEAVLSSSEATRVAVSDRDLHEAMEEIHGHYEEDVDLSEDLRNLGFDESFLRRAMARELHVNAVLDLVASEQSQVTDTDASLYYYMNIDKFKQPEIRIARHILVTINPDTPDNQRDTSLKKIHLIADRLNKKPERFEEQALKHSECPTSLEGGLLGKVKRGVLYPELEEVLFGLKVGELSGVVESPLGFHLVRCDEVEQEGTMPLDQVLPKLRSYLQDSRRKKIQRQWIHNLLQQTTQPAGELVNG